MPNCFYFMVPDLPPFNPKLKFTLYFASNSADYPKFLDCLKFQIKTISSIFLIINIDNFSVDSFLHSPLLLMIGLGNSPSNSLLYIHRNSLNI